MRLIVSFTIILPLLIGCGGGEENKGAVGPQSEKVPEYKPPKTFGSPQKASDKTKKVEIN